MGRSFSLVCAFVCGLAVASIGASAQAGGYRVLYEFQGGSQGAYPLSGLVNVGGTLFGTTDVGGVPATCSAYGRGCGIVFSLDLSTGAETIVHSFSNSGGDGALPVGSLIDVGSTLFGTTSAGGYAADCSEGSATVGCGVIYAVNPTTGATNTLYSFQGGDDGATPSASSLIGVENVLYGSTAAGGNSSCPPEIGTVSGCGTVFSLDLTTLAEKVVYSFQGGSQGSLPNGNLVQVGQNLYGTTSFGGLSSQPCPSYGCGIVFSLNLATGAEGVLHSFGGAGDGISPTSLIDVNGSLYGTTSGGGSGSCTDPVTPGCGTVFKLDPATGVERVVYSFQGGSDGNYPEAQMIKVGGKLFGTTLAGGIPTRCGPYGYGCGTVFSLDLSTGAESVVHTFQHRSGGFYPDAGLLSVGGNLYGTAGSDDLVVNCRANCGTVFTMKP